MGWAYGKSLEGREIGYSVQATCDEEDCEVEIDRGLAYACGSEHDEGPWFCDKYFCGDHLFFGGPNQQCKSCQEAHEKTGDCGDPNCGIHEDMRLAAEEDEEEFE